jgi:hypothetical protein
MEWQIAKVLSQSLVAGKRLVAGFARVRMPVSRRIDEMITPARPIVEKAITVVWVRVSR